MAEQDVCWVKVGETAPCEDLQRLGFAGSLVGSIFS